MERESKSARFKRLASSRGNRLIREIRLLGNLSNQKNYSYGPQEVDELFAPIEEALAEAKNLFEGGEGRVKFE